MEFDGFHVSTKFVACKDKESEVFTGHEEVKKFLKVPLREIDIGSNKHLLKEYKQMLRHLNRKSNELVFMKCSSPTCSICAGKPWQAKKTHKFLEERNFKLFRPEESENHPGQYATFLELCQLPPENIKDDDQNQPSVVESDLGQCTICPSYSFSSKTEKKPHISVCHRKLKTPATPASVQQKEYICNHKLGEGFCGKIFPSYYKLYQHKIQTGHIRKQTSVPKQSPAFTITRLLEKGNQQDEEEAQPSPSEPADGADRSEETPGPPKRPRLDINLVGRRVKVLYDEGTPKEKWWIGLAVEKLSKESHCIYFPEDQEVATVSNTECEVFDDEARGVIGKKVQVPFPDEDGHDQLWEGIIVGALKDNGYRVFFIADHKISDIKHQPIQFYRSDY